MTKPDPNNRWTLDALQSGDIDAIRARITTEPHYVNEPDFEGDTPLLAAIAFNELELVALLLKNGANPNFEPGDGYTCLLSAVESESDASLAMVDELLKAKADSNATGINGWAPLHMASARGHVDKAKLLIDAGADVNHRIEIDGEETPLMEAAQSGQADTVQLLLKHGADPDLLNTITSQTALEMAIAVTKGPDPEVIKTLKTEDFSVDVDELFEDIEIDLSPEERKLMQESFENVDMVQSYIDNTNSLIEKGNHKEVIRILKQATGNSQKSR